MAKRWLTSSGTNVIEHTVARIAIDGIVHDITKACVVDEGLVAQFWPPQAPSIDPAIVWTTTTITVTESVEDPSDSSAIISFSDGIFTYDNYPDADVSGLYVNPPPSGAGQYLIRVDQTGGDALTGTLGAWVDLFTDPQWSLDATVIGSLSATANISISQDDGGGSPVAATTVVKPATFISEVRSDTGITWSEHARNLIEYKVSVDADVSLIFAPDGTASGLADTAGAFTENWANNPPNPGDYTVQVDLLAGTAPTGNSLGFPFPLDQSYEWELHSGGDPLKFCVLNVTVDDLVPVGNAVTKQVEMQVETFDPESSSTWSATPAWNLDDIWDSGGGPAGAEILVNADGVVTGSVYNAPGTTEEDWNSDAPTPPDPGNFEAKLVLNSGASGNVSGALGVWINLATSTSWNVTSTAGVGFWGFTLYIRRVGGTAVGKNITVGLTVE